MKQLLWVTAVAILFTGCANTEKIEPETADINFYFAPTDTTKTTFTTANDLTWNITKAAMLPGEIGIHWEKIVARGDEPIEPAYYSPVAPRHDVSGKISPKIYGYYAVNLLETVHIQQLSIDPDKIYDHIHMVMLPANAVTTADSVHNIAEHPELRTNSMVISGTVSNGTDTLPFVFNNNLVYGENDLGDILISFKPEMNSKSRVVIHPDFELWFANVRWTHLDIIDSVIIDTQDPTKQDTVQTVKIDDEFSEIAFMNIEGIFKSDNALKCTIQKQ